MKHSNFSRLSIAALIAVSTLASCDKSDKDNGVQLPVEDALETKEKIRLAVFSDTHMMAPSLLIADGEAFEDYINHDRKMLKETTAILDQLLAKIEVERPDVVLIPGDLTKDGEEESHNLLISSYLSKMEEMGAKVYVTPGNHDVNNPHAVSFNGNNKNRVKTVSKDEFAKTYSEYGFKEAIARDMYSLTYVAQPYTNLRVLAIDACKYEENDYDKDVCVTGGRIKPQTMEFIREQVADAKENDVEFIAFMHHGLVQHWEMQETLMGEYLVDNWKNFADEFADLGIKLTFTGHFHSQDVVKHESNGKFTFDIETGSMVTYPCPYRIAILEKDKIEIESKFITSIDYDTEGKDFQAYAKEYVESGIKGLAMDMLPGVPEEAIELILPLATNAIVAHYAGDEDITIEEQKKINTVAFAANLIAPGMGDFLKSAAMGLWTDFKPSDNDVNLNLTTGDVQ